MLSPESANIDKRLIVRGLLAVALGKIETHPPRGLDFTVWTHMKGVPTYSIHELVYLAAMGKLDNLGQVGKLLRSMDIAYKNALKQI